MDDHYLDYQVDGATAYGSDEVLLEKEDNLIAGTSWAGAGYTVAPFLADDSYETLLEAFKVNIHDVVKKFVGVSFEEFSLEKYHEFVRDDETHSKIVSVVREGFPLAQFPIPLQRVENRVGELCGIDATAFNPFRSDVHVYYIRIVRPQAKSDNNPPHRDPWLDFLKDAVNIFGPVAGCNLKSALPLIPGSHLWKESEIERTVAGARVDGMEYQVPAVTGMKRSERMIRPNPNRNQIMVFSPYLIHGGGTNLNADVTRMSLEMRFWRKSKSIPNYL